MIPSWHIGARYCRRASYWRSTTRRWWATWKSRPARSSPTAASSGTTRVLPFTRPYARCARRAMPKYVSRSTAARSDVGVRTASSCEPYSMNWGSIRRLNPPRLVPPPALSPSPRLGTDTIASISEDQAGHGSGKRGWQEGGARAHDRDKVDSGGRDSADTLVGGRGGPGPEGAAAAAAGATAGAGDLGPHAAHAARSKLCRPHEGHHHPALARSRSQRGLLSLRAVYRTAFAATPDRIC